MTVTHHLPDRRPADRPGASPQPPALADVIDLLHHQVDVNRDSIAVDDGARRYNYAELGAMVADLAQRVRDAGVSPGSSVAVSPTPLDRGDRLPPRHPRSRRRVPPARSRLAGVAPEDDVRQRRRRRRDRRPPAH